MQIKAASSNSTGVTDGNGEVPLRPGEPVLAPNGPGIVVGHIRQSVLVSPTGQDPPYSTKVTYCEAWPPHHLVRRGWRFRHEPKD